MVKKSQLAVLAVAVFCAAAGVASQSFACGSGKLLYQEKFTVFPAWISASPEKSVGANGLSITENLGNTSWFQGPPDPYGNVEFCVTVSAQGAGSDVAGAGIGFYVFNSDNYYRFAVSNISGEFGVVRRTGGQWVVIIPDASNAAIRKGPTAENEVSVRTTGTHALLSVNGTAVAELDAPVAFVNDKRQSYADIMWVGYASDKPAYTFVFKDFQIRETQ